MEVKGIYKPEMVVSNAGRSYYVVVNLGSKQIDEETYAAAVEQIVLEAAQKALDLNVTFR